MLPALFRPTAERLMRSLEAYRDLIVRVERMAQASPLRYRVNLALLAALGFVYVIGMALLGLAAGLGVLILLLLSKAAALYKLALVPLALAALLIRSLWLRVPAPTGRKLSRRETPALFQEIERIRKAVRAKPVHEVILTPEFNAAVT